MEEKMKKHPLPNDTNGINKDDDEMIKKEQMGVELTKSFEGNEQMLAGQYRVNIFINQYNCYCYLDM